MIVYPAIDLLGGKCVRLYKGDFDQPTVYKDNPLIWAHDIFNDGSEWLHLVDLEGARDPNARQINLIEALACETELKVQCGGGVRKAEDVKQLLDSGVDRVIVGSVAVKDKDETVKMLETFGADKIALALDVKKDDDGVYRAAVSGWTESSDKLLTDLMAEYLEHGLKHVLCTDIDRDGTMEGPNVVLYDIISKQFPGISIQASGGVHSLKDLIELKEHTSVDGVIIGKAIYEGVFSVHDAITLANAEG